MVAGLRRILVATDFSDEAGVGVRQALALARRTGAELVLLHAFHPEGASEEISELERVADGALKEARDALEELYEQLAAAGPVVSKTLITGRPHEAICEAAKELDADLVVVGTHGRTGFRRILLGSVAERVVRYCERSVLVARGPEIAEGYRSILAATDFSPAAEHAVRLATQLAADESTLRIVHYYVLPSVTVGPAAGPELANAARGIEATLRDKSLAYREELARDGLRIEFHSSRGSAARELIDAVDTGSYDLIALGHSRHVGVRGRTIGTVAETVVRHARCSALVAPALE